jgi:glutathione S-transferase
VPTLEEDGFVLFESTAILNYLEATRGNPPLVPADARGRALVDMHMKLCDLQLSRYAGIIIFPKRFLPKERWNVAAIAEAKTEIERHLTILDKHLAGRSYLVADQFSTRRRALVRRKITPHLIGPYIHRPLAGANLK